MSYTQKLARYIVGMQFDRLPGAVVERVRTNLLYNLMMGLTGYEEHDPVWDAIRAVHQAPGKAVVLVTGEQRAPADAAFINAALVTGRGQNDTHDGAGGHVGCVVIPAVLALAQDRGVDARTVIAALAAGYEVAPKVALGATARTSPRGFRSTSVYGVFGAAAGAARVIGLNEERTANALAIAANFAGGVMQCWAEGTPEWRIQVANASRGGVVAALLAEQGVQGAKEALEGKSGFYQAFAGEVPPLALEGWEILRVHFKPFPGCAFNQTSVYTLLSLMKSRGIAPEQVEEVRVALHPRAYHYPGINSYGPFTAVGGAIMSSPFMLTAAMESGTLLRRHFTAGYGEGPLHERSRKVRLEADPGLASEGCRVSLRLKGGGDAEATFADADPFVFTWEETVDLLRPLTDEVPLPDAAGRAARMQTLLRQLEDEPDVDRLLAICTP